MQNFNSAGDSKHTSPNASRVGRGESGTRTSVDRKSPPTERVVQILNLLADAPRERLTLTQVSAALGLNKPTCLGILTALTDAEFVTRDDAKSYGLGPALLRLGSAAESGLANLDLVRPLITDLHDRLGVSCVLSAVHEGQIVILDRLGAAMIGDRRDLVGERLPLAPPLGLVNIAWEHDAVVDAWLGRPSLIPLATGDEKVRAIIADGRQRGYIIECLPTSSTSTVVLASLLSSGMPQRVIDELCRHLPATDWSEYLATIPRDATTTPVAHISAPIFDRHGAQQYTLTLVPERADATPAQCREWTTALLETTRQATIALGGQ
ncbi:IclR family transcriptional regulator [Prescottella agglutinans]|uniref:IclR family transcriptional regulator n=1 Tax=Prescottella agglutinans TaxID=1644129 RepID=A0A438B9S5_9NOCA|nr:helix-turn-helix domain-containing protein [Prescottella agglutinans]RVW07641.1 IclR family transcriptional regulator [Prescottella agglutinans]